MKNLVRYLILVVFLSSLIPAQSSAEVRGLSGLESVPAYNPADNNRNLFPAAESSENLVKLVTDGISLTKPQQAPGDTTPPPAPTPISPANGSTVSTTTPTFTWSAVSDASAPVLYDLQVASQSNMASPFINKTNLATVTYTLSGAEALNPGAWYWRVRARDSATPAWNYSAWSSPAWSFNVPGTATAPLTIAWTRQFGTGFDDYAYSVSLDSSGNIYMVGQTYGALPGGGGALGSSDVFLRKYDPTGSIAWTRQFGSGSIDYIDSLSLDSSGNIYVVGFTNGAIPGGGGALGDYDVFLRKYDPTGSVAWTRQFGSGYYDVATMFSLDSSGNIYVAGHTSGALSGGGGALGGRDAFLRKYDSTGSAVWTRQFGSGSDDYAYSVSLDSSGNIYVAGHTNGALPGGGGSSGSFDVFLRKYDTAGSVVWTRQFGSGSDDYDYTLSLDSSGNIYVAGYTLGALPGGGGALGGFDVFLRKYDSVGSEVWTRQFGTGSDEYAYSVSLDISGNIYVAGHTNGAMPGGGGALGGADAFLRKYDSAGSVIWTLQFGTGSDEYAYSVSLDISGNIYVAGYTLGALPGGGGALGGNDAFLMKWSQPYILDTNPPPIPTPISPANGSAVNKATPTFTWSAVSDASLPVLYDLQISDDYLGTPVIYKTNLYTNTYTLSSAERLGSGGWWYWRVRVRDSSASPAWNYSAWSSPVRFYVSENLWALPIIATFLSESGIKSDWANAEANSASTTGLDFLYDAEDPPDPPSTPVIDIEFRSTAPVTSLIVDTRPLTGIPASQSWDFSVKAVTDLGNSFPVTVAWSMSSIPLNYLAAIQDQGNLAATNMWSSSQYVYGATDGLWRNFKLFVRENRAPQVAVIYPNGGSVRGTVTVTALASDPDGGTVFNDGIASVSFFYSANSGATWSYIGPGSLVSGNMASGAWTVSWNTAMLAEGSNYKIRVTVQDSRGASAQDESDGTLSIVPAQWKIDLAGRLTTASGQSYSDNVSAGVDPAASSGDDILDIPNPPPLPQPPYLDMFFLNVSSTLSRDMRPHINPTTWSLRVKPSEIEGSVTITASYAGVPLSEAGFIILEDTTTGVSQNLRTTPAYTYIAAADISRSFNLIVKSNTPPSVRVIYPEGATVAGVVSVMAQASDSDSAAPYNDKVASVTFQYASGPYTSWKNIGAGALVLGTSASGVWSVSWNTPLAPPGAGYKVRAIAIDTVGGSGQDDSDTTFTIIPSILVSVNWPAGWHMFSYPLLPQPATNSWQLGDNISPLFVYHYNEISDVYELTNVATPGWGYWTKLSTAGPVDVIGLPVTDAFFDIALGSSWNQIGSPYNTTVAWNSVSFIKDGVAKSLKDAAAADWVSQWIYYYDTQNGVYVPKGAADGVLTPLVGYWMRALLPGVTLRIPRP